MGEIAFAVRPTYWVTPIRNIYVYMFYDTWPQPKIITWRTLLDYRTSFGRTKFLRPPPNTARLGPTERPSSDTPRRLNVETVKNPRQSWVHSARRPVNAEKLTLEPILRFNRKFWIVYIRVLFALNAFEWKCYFYGKTTTSNFTFRIPLFRRIHGIGFEISRYDFALIMRIDDGLKSN